MKGYIFTCIDSVMYEEGVYLNFEKAFARLVELNHERFEVLKEKHNLADEISANKSLVNNGSCHGFFYGLDEIDIIE